MRELRERAEPALRILCLILAAVVVYELAGMLARLNPFHGVKVPELPALAAATNSPAAGAKGTNESAAARSKGTNGVPQPMSTNTMPSAGNGGTNQLLAKVATNGTNSVVQGGPTAPAISSLTNAVVGSGTNRDTNAVAPAATNLLAAVIATTNSTVTNGAALAVLSTNGGTNLAPTAAAAGTNQVPAAKPKKKKSGAGPELAGMGPGQASGPGVVDLPPAVKTRISRITDSEILGPVIHPLPMALLGIAGPVVFLRSESGQTGLVKEGDSLDNVKLLKIGINRVLIEQNGQKKELTIFSGYGGDSLLQTDTTNENKHL